MFQTEVVEKIKTHFMFSNFFFSENRAIFDSVENPGIAIQATDENIIGRMRLACCMTRAAVTRIHKT
jgi:hypothetical protein